jgi:hypothetical protein
LAPVLHVFFDGRVGEDDQPRTSCFGAFWTKKEPVAIFSQPAFRNFQNLPKVLKGVKEELFDKNFTE